MKWPRCKPAADSAWGDDRGGTLYCTIGNNNKKASSYWQTHTKQIYGENNKHQNPPGLRKQDVFVPLLSPPLSEWVRRVNEWVGDWVACCVMLLPQTFHPLSLLLKPFFCPILWCSWAVLLEGWGIQSICWGAKLQLLSSWHVGTPRSCSWQSAARWRSGDRRWRAHR